MADNVTHLKEDGKELVSFLRDLADRAERGEVHAVAAVIGSSQVSEDDSRYETFAGGAEYEHHRIGLIGAMQCLMHEIITDQIRDDMVDE